MSKQKLAELVMQKMEAKRLEEERNRPHREVLQLLVKFQIEDYRALTEEIRQLEQNLADETARMEEMQQCINNLENTGKKKFPRIIINPDFIASEHIKPLVKQYYRKAANTFLREDILRRKQFEVDVQKMEQIIRKFQQLKSSQQESALTSAKDHDTTNQKRVRNLKEDLRKRAFQEQQVQLKKMIEDERNQNLSLIKEYQIKKTNLESRISWCEKLATLIEKQKNIIQEVYNPVAYRDYLKTIFGIRTKNEFMQKNLLQVVKKVADVEKSNTNNERQLQKKYNFFIQGRCADSPSKRKRSSNSHQQFYSVSPAKRRAQPEIRTPSGRDRMITEKLSSPKTTKNDSRFGNSIGKTTASSMSNLFKDTGNKRRAFSSSMDINENKNKIMPRMA